MLFRSFARELASESPGDAAPDAALDAAPDATPRTWMVIETLVINTASSTPRQSQTVLAAEVTYRLRVSGTINTVIDNHQGDADYYDFGNPKDLGCCEDIGLGIDDIVVNDKVTLPDWGPYNPTHVYEADWVGEGATISALFQDTLHSNNQGNLTLEILEYR